MAKSASNSMLDGALNVLKNNADKMVACSAEPTSFAQGNATYALADVAMASGDFTLADGDVSGRKCTVAAKSGITVDDDGTVTHVCLLDTANSALLYVTTVSSQAVTQGGTLDIGSWKIEIADPS